MHISLPLLCFSPSHFPFSFPIPAAEWFRAEAKHIARQIALEKEATERQEEAVTLRHEVASLQRKLEKLAVERKDILKGTSSIQVDTGIALHVHSSVLNYSRDFPMKSWVSIPVSPIG